MEDHAGDRGHEDPGQGAPIAKREFWNGRAREFSEYAATTGYPERFIRVIRPRKTWTVLDMGCGGGTLAVPLAPRVRSITAADFSETMLDVVNERCERAGITNVRTLRRRWEDEWNDPDGGYDIAIASRSLIGDDTKALVQKLDGVARKAVYISMVGGSGPFDRALYESTGRKSQPGEDYVHYYQALYDVGIRANVTFIAEDHRNGWKDHQEALDDQRWMFRAMTTDEEDRVKEYLARHLVKRGGLWKLPYSKRCYWAVMWWQKTEGKRLV
jgi:SAM-dependent methyltransferase